MVNITAYLADGVMGVNEAGCVCDAAAASSTMPWSAYTWGYQGTQFDVFNSIVVAAVGLCLHVLEQSQKVQVSKCCKLCMMLSQVLGSNCIVCGCRSDLQI